MNELEKAWKRLSPAQQKIVMYGVPIVIGLAIIATVRRRNLPATDPNAPVAATPIDPATTLPVPVDGSAGLNFGADLAASNEGLLDALDSQRSEVLAIVAAGDTALAEQIAIAASPKPGPTPTPTPTRTTGRPTAPVAAAPKPGPKPSAGPRPGTDRSTRTAEGANLNTGAIRAAIEKLGHNPGGEVNASDVLHILRRKGHNPGAVVNDGDVAVLMRFASRA